MTDQNCTEVVDGEKCGASLSYRATIRGGEVELYTCAANHKRHINRQGRQYNTHANPHGKKKNRTVRLWDWQSELLVAHGQTPQMAIDSHCYILASRDIISTGETIK